MLMLYVQQYYTDETDAVVVHLYLGVCFIHLLKFLDERRVLGQHQANFWVVQ